MKDYRIIFDLPENIVAIEVIGEILKNNGLEESSKEFFNKSIKGIEPKKNIVRDAAIALFEKKIPEEKLSNLLTKHLETSKETAEKIIQNVKERLIPYAKEVEEDTETTRSTEDNTTTQKVILEKIQEKTLEQKLQEKPKEEPLPPGVKKPGNTNVEQNAKLMEKKSIPIVDQDLVENKGEKKVITVIEKKEEPNPLDTYREPVE